MFDDAPMPMLLENWAGIKAMLREAQAAGITDWEHFLETNPEFLEEAQRRHLFLDANRATVNLFGARDKAQFLHAMATLLPKTPTTDSAILRAMIRGDAFARGERVIQTLDGRTLTILWEVDLSSDSAEHLLFMAIDISDRRATEEALHRAQAELTHATRAAALGEMAASIAHEVNQPLAAIVLYAESAMRWLERAEPDVGRAMAGLQKIARSARHAGDVVHRVKGFVRKDSPERVPLDLREIFADTELLVQREARNQGVALRFELPAELPVVAGVKVQVQQVLVNLIINAIQAFSGQCATGRQVVVTAAAGVERTLLITVRDNGPGIATQDLERVFEPFFSTRPEGLGMGLAICRSIAEAHGGTIEARNPGGGAAFVLTIGASTCETLPRG